MGLKNKLRQQTDKRGRRVAERGYPGEGLAIVCVALMIFFTIAFFSYTPGNETSNLVGQAGYITADLFRRALGLAAYLFPATLLYFVAVRFRLLTSVAPITQTSSFFIFTLGTSALLSLMYNDEPGFQAGGWIGGFLALHLLQVGNIFGSYLIILPVLLVSFSGLTQVSLGSLVLKLLRLCKNTFRFFVGIVGPLGGGIFDRAGKLLNHGRPYFRQLRVNPWRSNTESHLPGDLRESDAGGVSAQRLKGKRRLVKTNLGKSASATSFEEGGWTNDSCESNPPIIVSRTEQSSDALGFSEPAALPFPEQADDEQTYDIPSVALLDPPVRLAVKVDEEELRTSSRVLESKLADFGVAGRVIAVRPGPVITTYEFEPAPGVKVNRVVSLADDLQMALRAVSVRILAPIPGKAVVGIEVSNTKREKVCIREILDSSVCRQTESPLALALGKDTVGNPVTADLSRMPHLLVAGATGTGKSVSLNVMIMSILARSTPQDVRFIMIDPKMLELSLYENLPHQLSHVVTNAKEAGAALQEVVRRMEYRYKLLKDKGVRNVASYNRALETGDTPTDGVIKLTEVINHSEEEEGEDHSAEKHLDKPAPLALNHQRLPYLVVLVDELADLMLTVGREIEEPITRLAQMGRAAGIHLILATQRPSVDVITGLIKANFPARISFQVSSRIDSRTILDAVGAERLLGDGDMLFLPPGSAKPQRIHGAFVSEPEIRKFCAAIKKQGKPVFDPELISALENARSQTGPKGMPDDEDYDEMYEQARELVIESRQASISWVQRRLRVGYNRAARMIERMEREGLIAPAGEAGKPREVLVDSHAEME